MAQRKPLNLLTEDQAVAKFIADLDKEGGAITYCDESPCFTGQSTAPVAGVMFLGWEDSRYQALRRIVHCSEIEDNHREYSAGTIIEGTIVLTRDGRWSDPFLVSGPEIPVTFVDLHWRW